LKDSIERSNKGKLSDSLSKKNANLVTMDSNSRKKYIELQQKLTELEDKYSEIQSLRVSDSILLSDKLNKEKDPKKILEDIGSSASGFKLLKSILNVERVGIGIVSPEYNQFVLNSVSLKGLDFAISKKDYFYDITVGRSTRNSFGPFSEQTQNFDRNIGVARIGVGTRDRNHISIEHFYGFDEAFIDSFSPKVINSVTNFHGKFGLLSGTSIEADWAFSTYKEQYPYPRIIQ